MPPASRAGAEKTLQTYLEDPTKPTKPGFVGFVGFVGPLADDVSSLRDRPSLLVVRSGQADLHPVREPASEPPAEPWRAVESGRVRWGGFRRDGSRSAGLPGRREAGRIGLSELTRGPASSMGLQSRFQEAPEGRHHIAWGVRPRSANPRIPPPLSSPVPAPIAAGGCDWCGDGMACESCRLGLVASWS
jgi:hypothetical protein